MIVKCLACDAIYDRKDESECRCENCRCFTACPKCECNAFVPMKKNESVENKQILLCD